jgi:hypothetical protein
VYARDVDAAIARAVAAGATVTMPAQDMFSRAASAATTGSLARGGIFSERSGGRADAAAGRVRLGLVASGPRAGHPVRWLRSAAAVVDGAKPRCARLEGFSLHANVAVPAHARERLEHLGRYLLRPPLARERLTQSSHGQVVFELPHPRAAGATHLLLDPLDLIEKMSVLIPTTSSNCTT